MIATLDWYGCATFRLTLGELVIFLDAYIDRVPGAPGTGLHADDIERADWIVVGHSHFDHLWGAERIARRTGATIIGSHETVRIMEKEGVPLAQLLAVSGGERIRLSSEITVAVYPSLHSCVWTAQGGMRQPDEVCLGDLWLTYQERIARLEEMVQWRLSLGPQVQEHLQVSNQEVRGDGGSFVYLFETPEGSLLYQDTSGLAFCTTCVLMSQSWLRQVVVTSMASRSREHLPLLWRSRPICCAHVASFSATMITGCQASLFH